MLPSANYRNINFRLHPELYKIGVGEQGVLTAQPYKSEILPYWKFKTPTLARKSANDIWKLFKKYGEEEDFVGMDMARKYLQMGYTRSRRYARHKSGKKYLGPVPANKKGLSGSHGRPQLPLDPDPIKDLSASIFYKKWKDALKNRIYLRLKKAFISKKESK